MLSCLAPPPTIPLFNPHGDEMLFNSFDFLGMFLPITLAGFYLLKARGWATGAIYWLGGASFVFYGWGNPALVVLLLCSILFNYGVGSLIHTCDDRNQRSLAHLFMVAGIGADLLVLMYYKYMTFFVTSCAAIFGVPISVPAIVLPIGISFFTFTQIAYLVDTYQRRCREHRFSHYSLFVSYFPHLVSGPILHHLEMVPQFERTVHQPTNWNDLAAGVTALVLGLVKKVLIADSLAPIVDQVYSAASAGTPLSIADSWAGALGYTFQLYFDFSGYCDMAMGISLLLGIRLPANFDSPYRATSIIDFWRRWHMTLSRFLRDYLYFPLGGNRNGAGRRYINLMIVMVLGGLWHGAGWTFVAWGTLHGLYLLINHMFRAMVGRATVEKPVLTWASRVLTFICVVVAWVFFRATSFHQAGSILTGMVGLGTGSFGAPPIDTVLWLGACLVIVWALPNSLEIFAHYRLALEKVSSVAWGRWQLHWRPNLPLAILSATAACACLLSLNKASPFLYFNF